MNILIAGATGFIGKAMTQFLTEQGHSVTALGRDVNKIRSCFNRSINAVNWDHLAELDSNEFDIILNLAGENIGQKAWSDEYKKNIKQSRIQSTTQLLHWCEKLTKKLKYYSASAIGIYGLQTQGHALEPFTEDTLIAFGKPTDFLSEVGQEWELAAMTIENPLIEKVFLRFAPILHESDGALKKLLLPYKLGLGGPLGDGSQPFTWIHLHDAVQAIYFLMQHPELSGPVNLCAPEWVPQKIFAKTLGKVLRRPAILPTPAWILKLVFGQMAEELLLSGQAVYPQKLLSFNFEFKYPHLKEALEARSSF